MMRSADLSISLGIAGTEAAKSTGTFHLVTKRVAAMILLDDQLNTLVDVLAEGKLNLFIAYIKLAKNLTSVLFNKRNE